MDAIINKIVSVFENRGGEKYADEDVTQLEHALQCAEFAEKNQESDEMIVAALLHDIGHIISELDLPPDCDHDLDDDHESAGYEFLYARFGDDVAEPVRLHVAAKRYLCTTQPEYVSALSPTSYKSYLDQGGEMSSEELREFESNDFFESAIRLRKWDDTAKDPENVDLTIDQFLPYVQSVFEKRQKLVRK